VSYPTTPLDDARWLAMIEICALAVLAVAIVAFPTMYVPPGVTVTLGILLCGGAVVLPLVSPSFVSRVGLLGITSLGLTGLASLALAATLSRFDRRLNRPAAAPTAWWRLPALALASVGAIGLGAFLFVIVNPGAIFVLGAATSWLLAAVALGVARKYP
jgi:hypothetical protein